jgi:hypothetical protein
VPLPAVRIYPFAASMETMHRIFDHMDGSGYLAAAVHLGRAE